MDDLKKELDMDWHRITWDELCTRLETSTETVSHPIPWPSNYAHVKAVKYFSRISPAYLSMRHNPELSVLYVKQ